MFVESRGCITGFAILVVAGIMALGVSMHSDNQKPVVLRVAFSTFRSISRIKLDPARVDTITQANLIRNLYSRLVEYLPDGSLAPAAAESFEWRGRSVYFRMRESLKTASGIPITAEDAAISLKRLLIKGLNTHGDLRNFLCPDAKITSLVDDCPGIATAGNTLVLTAADDSKKVFLVPLLASVDFSLIPRSGMDLSVPDLPIVNFRETSGAYFVAEDDENGAYELRASPHHFRYSSGMADVIKFVPSYGDEAVAKFRTGEIDLIPTLSFVSPGQMQSLLVDFPEASFHQTQNIALRAVTYTRRGQLEIPREHRLFVGDAIRSRFNDAFPSEKVNLNHEFFPVFGEGSLDPSQQSKLRDLFQDIGSGPDHPQIEFGVPTGDLAVYQKSFGSIPGLKFTELSVPPWTLPDEQQPHAYISFIDSAFFEDISLISYNIDLGTFGLSRSEGADWLNDYMATESKSMRLQKLRSLHFQFLFEGRVVPIGNLPYVAIAKAPWEIGFSKFFAGSSLWQIKRK